MALPCGSRTPGFKVMNTRAFIASPAWLQLAHHPVAQIVSGSSDKENFAHRQIRHVAKIGIRLVENDDFARLNRSTKFPSTTAILHGSCLDDSVAALFVDLVLPQESQSLIT